MQFGKLFLAAGFALAIAAAAVHPAFSGIWTLDSSQSTGDVPAWSSMSIGQDSHWFRMAQSDKNGRTIRNVEGECRTDGRFHPVDGGDGGSISCKWDGSTLVTLHHWDNDRQERTVRTMLSPDGKLVQEIHQTSPDGTKDAHLVWAHQ